MCCNMSNMLLSLSQSSKSATTIYDNPDLIRVVSELSSAIKWGYFWLGASLLCTLGIIFYRVYKVYKGR